ncbi:MAG: putative restriction endonuclease [Chthonomonadales bacterium]|nr:putative restriction endonuclease [Chthonomonadales bacterium]
MTSSAQSHVRRTSGPSDPESLLALPFPVFVCSIARLLVHLGYHHVSIKKPLHRNGRGSNSAGGLTIEAYQVDGLTRTRVIAQVKQHAHPVPRSFVDELRGAMVRQGALLGLLFTAGTFSPSARLAALYATNSLPVRLVDGAELVRLLKAKEVPIRADSSSHSSAPPRPQPERVADPLEPGASSNQSMMQDAPPARATSRVTITFTIGSAEDQIEHPHIASS